MSNILAIGSEHTRSATAALPKSHLSKPGSSPVMKLRANRTDLMAMLHAAGLERRHQIDPLPNRCYSRSSSVPRQGLSAGSPQH